MPQGISYGQVFHVVIKGPAFEGGLHPAIIPGYGTEVGPLQTGGNNDTGGIEDGPVGDDGRGSIALTDGISGEIVEGHPLNIDQVVADA